MGKLIIVKKEQLKISLEEHKKLLKGDTTGASLIQENGRKIKEAQEELKEKS